MHLTHTHNSFSLRTSILRGAIHQPPWEQSVLVPGSMGKEKRGICREAPGQTSRDGVSGCCFWNSVAGLSAPLDKTPCFLQSGRACRSLWLFKYPDVSVRQKASLTQTVRWPQDSGSLTQIVSENSARVCHSGCVAYGVVTVGGGSKRNDPQSVRKQPGSGGIPGRERHTGISLGHHVLSSLPGFHMLTRNGEASCRRWCPHRTQRLTQDAAAPA